MRCVTLPGGLTDEDIANFKKGSAPAPIATSIPVKAPTLSSSGGALRGQSISLPWRGVKGYKRRYYPFGSALTHVIGYVSKINDKDVERLDKKKASWRTTPPRMT